MKFLMSSTRKSTRDIVKNEDLRRNLGVECVIQPTERSRLMWFGQAQTEGEKKKTQKWGRNTDLGKSHRGRPRKGWSDKGSGKERYGLGIVAAGGELAR